MDAHDLDALRAARDSAALALEHVHRGGDAWLADRLYVDAVSKRIEEVCERLLDVSDEAQARLGDIDWVRVRGMRNRLVHACGVTDLDVLESVVTTTLPQLIRTIGAVTGDDAAT